jgi:hypothetical protein
MNKNNEQIENVCLRLRSWIIIIDDDEFDKAVSDWIAPNFDMSLRELRNHVMRVYTAITGHVSNPDQDRCMQLITISVDYLALLSELDSKNEVLMNALEGVSQIVALVKSAKSPTHVIQEYEPNQSLDDFVLVD